MRDMRTLPAESRPPIMGANGRLDATIECEVDSITKEKFARAARLAGKTSAAALLREMIEERASMVPMVPTAHQSLSGEK